VPGAAPLVILSVAGLLPGRIESKPSTAPNSGNQGNGFNPMGTAPLEPARTGAPRFQRLRVIAALMIREMGTTYGRSAGGYLWAIAHPLGGIVLLAIAFSLALRSPPLGTSFMLFYATGIVPFSMFNAMSNGAAGAIKSNRGLLTYPVVFAVDAVLAQFLLKLLTLSVVGLIMFTGIILIFDLHVNYNPVAMVRAMFLAAILGLGTGTLNCVLFGFFPTWKTIWAVLTRPLFIISGIFFLFEDAPAEFQALLWYNPLVHVIGDMRMGFFGSYDPQFISYPFVVGLSLVLFTIGLYLLRRHESFLIEQ
jgi:capsular polysaccharide transport system permease protein